MMPAPCREESPLIVFAGGGTGGHLYPAMSLMSAIRRSVPKARFLLFGSNRSMDGRVVGGSDCELVCQPLPRFSGRLKDWPAVLRALRSAGRICRHRLASDRPSVVISSGGFSAVPALREAHRLGAPVVLLNPDAIPGRVNRCFATIAQAIFVQWEDATRHFPAGAQVSVSGCPIRPGFRPPAPSCQGGSEGSDSLSGIERFSLDPDRKTLLVTGASQGARTINEAVLANLDLLASFDDWQVLHLTGEDAHEAMGQAYARRGIRATVLAFTDHMADALKVADLVVSRAGASTLAELTAVGTASILMPYPFHRDQHQMANARCLARTSAAMIVQDAIDVGQNGPALGHVLASLMRDETRREAMAAAAQQMGCADAADRIADSIIALVFDGANGIRTDSLERSCSWARYEPGVSGREERSAICEVR